MCQKCPVDIGMYMSIYSSNDNLTDFNNRPLDSSSKARALKIETLHKAIEHPKIN